MSKIRKIYNLRKTANVRQQPPPEESRVSQFREEPEQNIKVSDHFDRNLSLVSNQRQLQSKVFEEQTQYEVDGQELSINKLQLNFEVPINDIDKKDVRIKNIGNSAVYVRFSFKNAQKINNNGFKDSKNKFYCHYQNTVIKPGEEVTFIFSFISEFPGNFSEEVEIICKPPLKTPIPNLKLNGNASISDQWLADRNGFNSDLSDIVLKNEVRQILADIVSNVRLPPPPLPDVRDKKVAEREFESKNAGLNLYFNEYLHNWFNELFNQICEKKNIPEEDRYWDQSISTLQKMIDKADYLDDVQKKCYRNRIQHYCYLSMNKQAHKSELYETVYKFVSEAAYNMGGDYVDAARKELDMWEVPFREPLETDTEQDLKARKEEVDKIKADWVKKAKKKKWGEEEEREMVNEFKKKVQQKVNQDILDRFTNFEEGAEFIKTRELIKKSTFDLEEYHKYLERIKTVRECALDGKKVLIKWNLKLKKNCEEKLKELEEYLTKKKQHEKRLEEEKREGAKKKKAVKPKKKGQKEEEDEKPLFFDFMSILDQENWNGFTQTFKVVMEKQPFLILIGITYGPRVGRHLPQHSVQFLLQHLKTIESGIQFFPHEQLHTLSQKLENQTIGEGSILLMENLNFLPSEVTMEEVIEPPAEEGHEAKTTKRKLLHPEIRDFFDDIGDSIDVLVNEDRFLSSISGFSAYLNKQVLVGTQWWRYVALSTRVIDSTLIFGDDFTPSTYLLLSRVVKVVKEIRLAGSSGIKFYLWKNNLERLGDVCLGGVQKEAINDFMVGLEQEKMTDKIKIPCDFLFEKKSEEQTQTIEYDGTQDIPEEYRAIDIGPKTIEELSCIRKGHLFVLGQTGIQTNNQKLPNSLSKLLKNFFKQQEAKKDRHAHQSTQPSGIDYTEDLVIYLVGLDEALIEKADLKDKKPQTSEQEEQQAGEQEQEAEGDKRKAELVSDYRLGSLGCLYRLWDGRFDMGLRDISKYEMILDD